MITKDGPNNKTAKSCGVDVFVCETNKKSQKMRERSVVLIVRCANEVCCVRVFFVGGSDKHA